MKLETIIIDDEWDAIEALENVIDTYIEGVTVVAKTNKPKQAIELLKVHSPDFIFLDIQMPVLNGFEFLECIPEKKFEVIFVTAYDQYAIKAIKANALDYVLKPIRIPEIMQAVSKVKDLKLKSKSLSESFHKLSEELKNREAQSIKIPTLSGIDFVKISDIIRLEASGSYTEIVLLNEERLLFSKRIKEAEKLLNYETFFRTHRSHIINLKHVKRYENNDCGMIVMADGSRIALSRRKKCDFFKAMNIGQDEHME